MSAALPRTRLASGRCSRRTRAAQRVPDSHHDAPRITAADLDAQPIYRKPVLGGLINEYSRAA